MENIYHRYLDIPFDPGVDLMSKSIPCETAPQHIPINENEISQDLIEWFRQRGIIFLCYEAFYTPPSGGKIAIHTDLGVINDVAKVNWTYGAPGSTLIWWEVDKPENIICSKSTYDIQILTCEEQHCRKVCEREINKPSLINAGRFHSTHNPTTEKRWTLSLPIFREDGSRLDWIDAYEMLKDWIVDR